MRWSDQLSMYLRLAYDSDQALSQLPIRWFFLVSAFRPRPMKMSKRKMMSKREMITQNWAKSTTLLKRKAFHLRNCYLLRLLFDSA